MTHQLPGDPVTHRYPPQVTTGTDVPPTLRPAATVMLVRDGPDGSTELEVLMVRRNLNSDFVGGAYVFPGGAVDPGDGGPQAESLCQGRTDAQASRLLGLAEGGLAYWVAVLRECFEEAGLLLAYDHGTIVSFAERDDESRFAAGRGAVNRGELRFLELCRREQLRLATDSVHYFAHWITPQGAPRRYDTRFFVAAAPPEQTPAHDAGETIAAVWITPHEALRRHREGEIELIFPTIRNLQAISRFSHSTDLIRAAEAAAGRVPAVEPRVVADGRGVRIVLPGDPGYEEGVPAQAPSDAGEFSEAVRAISHQANRAPGPAE